MREPLVSIIMVTLNNKDWLLKSLKNLFFEQNYKNLEVLLVDNGSKDGTLSAIREKYPQVKLIEAKKNIGFGRAANKAIRKSSGKYVLIYNDDAICGKDAIGLLVRKLEENDDLAACQGTMLFADGSKNVESQGAFLTPTGILIKEAGFKFDSKRAKEHEVFNANLPMIKKKVLDEIGIFDEDYFLYFEEADLCWRIWLAGYRIVYYPKPIIYHARGVTTRKLKPPLIIESAFENRINSQIKNLELGSLVYILPYHLIICFCGALAYIFKLKPLGAYAILRAIYRNLREFPRTLDKRKKIQEKRRIRDKELFKIVMKPMGLKYFISVAYDYLRSW